MKRQLSKVALLRDLQAVAKKYNIRLSACGCCDGFHASYEEDTVLSHMTISPNYVAAYEDCRCEGGPDDLCASCGALHCRKCTGRDICITCLYAEEMTA